MIRKIDGAALKTMTLSAAAAVERDKQRINDLNVFPVPDGDTGTNMSLTLGASVDVLNNAKNAGVGKIGELIAGALLRGARGNSGVITSLLCRGFSRGVKALDEMDGADLAAAMKLSSETAYNAVMKPAEGTILTVSRLAAEKAAVAAEEDPSFEYVLEQALLEAKRALPETMEQNPVLKKAGVVDAGAVGYTVILEAALQALRGKITDAPAASREKADFSSFSTEEINFTYCTEFIIEREGSADPFLFRDFLNGIGDSLVFVEDDEIIKVHVHTNDPGQVLHEAIKHGAFSMVKIENMRLQHTAKINAAESAPSPAPAPAPVPARTEPDKDLGFVAVCSGEGLCSALLQIGVDSIVQGGQTMNPSTQDILNAIESTPSRAVIVLPNNKNIILAAQQCVGLTDKDVRVIPTTSIPEGISAMISVNPDMKVDDAEETMKASAACVRTMEVTYAARDAQFDGWDIKQGDYLALDCGKPFGMDPDLDSLLGSLAKSAGDSDCEYICIYYGQDVTADQAEHTKALFESACPNAEVNLVDGGQPVYCYMISVE